MSLQPATDTVQDGARERSAILGLVITAVNLCLTIRCRAIIGITEIRCSEQYTRQKEGTDYERSSRPALVRLGQRCERRQK